MELEHLAEQRHPMPGQVSFAGVLGLYMRWPSERPAAYLGCLAQCGHVERNHPWHW